MRGNEEFCFSPSQEEVPTDGPQHILLCKLNSSQQPALSNWQAMVYFLTAPALEASGSATLGAGQKTVLPRYGVQCLLDAVKTILPAIKSVIS